MDTRGDNFYIKQSWLRKLFNWTAQGEPPPDIDARIHRQALWAAFYICSIVFVIAYAMRILYDVGVIYGWPICYAYSVIYLERLLLVDLMPGGILSSTLFFFIIYAASLRRHGAQIPYAAHNLIATIIVVYLAAILPYWTLLKYGSLIPLVIIAAGLFLSGHVRTRRARILLWLTLAILLISALYETCLSLYGALIPVTYDMFATVLMPDVIKALWVPFGVLLPCCLLASPRVPVSLGVIKPPAKWFGPLETVIALLLGAAAMLYFRYLPLEMPPNLVRLVFGTVGALCADYWVLPLALFALYVFAKRHGDSTRRLCSYLLLVIAVYWILMNISVPVTWWGYAMLGFMLFLSVLIPLWISADRESVKVKLRAASLILLNSAIFAVYDGMVYGPTRLLLQSYNEGAPFQLVLRLAIASFVLLAFIPVTVILAWRLISPGDVDGLMRR